MNTAVRMWVVEMTDGEKFTITADTKAEAIEKAERWRKKTKVKSVKNVAETMRRKKYNMP